MIEYSLRVVLNINISIYIRNRIYEEKKSSLTVVRVVSVGKRINSIEMAFDTLPMVLHFIEKSYSRRFTQREVKSGIEYVYLNEIFIRSNKYNGAFLYWKKGVMITIKYISQISEMSTEVRIEITFDGKISAFENLTRSNRINRGVRYIPNTMKCQSKHSK